jgi:pilus assembly protein CpaB
VSNRRTLMAAAAIVLALVAGIGVYVYASGADKRAQENASLVSAYVANADIAKGTTGAEIAQAGLVTSEKVAKSSVPPGMITNLNDLADLMTAGPISSKQFITSGSFVSAKDGGGGVFSNSIAANDLVAVTVTVDADHGVANQISPGDHVNMATTTTDENGISTTSYMLENVKVLAVGSNTTLQAPATDGTAADGSTPAPTNSGVLTFEVSQHDALRIISANSGSSKLYLVLLPPTTTPATSNGGTKAAASK